MKRALVVYLKEYYFRPRNEDKQVIDDKLHTFLCVAQTMNFQRQRSFCILLSLLLHNISRP